jgi:hypothetical protein
VVPEYQGLLPFGHTPTEIYSQDSLGEKSQTELECPRSVVLISKFRGLCRCLRGPTPAAMAASHMAFTTGRPEDRRILTIGQSE